MSTYTQLNGQTVSDITGAKSNTQEQKWVLKAYKEGRGKHILQRLIGGYKSGKPIIQIADFTKLKGDTVFLHSLAPLGGAGVQGDNQRVGKEEKQRFSNYSFKVGQKWHGTGRTALAAAQTVIGSNFDLNARSQLGEWHNWQQGLELEMQMVAAAHARNTLRPNYKLSREALTTLDFMQGETVTRARSALSGLQGKPLVLGKGSSPLDDWKGYLFIGNQFTLAAFKQTPSYVQICSGALNRGMTNPLIGGGLPDWDGNALAQWDVEDHTADGPIGAVCAPRLFLASAIASGDTADVIRGGLGTNGTGNDPLYAGLFPNAAFVGYAGTLVNADTSTDRYALIKDATTGKFMFINYRVNNGNSITIRQRLSASNATYQQQTVGNVTWGSAPWTTAYLTESAAAGSLMVPCTSYGVPFGYNYLIADEMAISGYGAHELGGTAMGHRTEEKQDHGRLYAVGLEMCWGCKPMQRADDLANGFVLIESAFKLDGMPDITSAA